MALVMLTLRWFMMTFNLCQKWMTVYAMTLSTLGVRSCISTETLSRQIFLASANHNPKSFALQILVLMTLSRGMRSTGRQTPSAAFSHVVGKAISPKQVHQTRCSANRWHAHPFQPLDPRILEVSNRSRPCLRSFNNTVLLRNSLQTRCQS